MYVFIITRRKATCAHTYNEKTYNDNYSNIGTAKQLTDEIMRRKLFNEDVILNVEDVQQFLERLCYDGTVQRILKKKRKRGHCLDNTAASTSTVYMRVPSRKRSRQLQHFTSTPCGLCAVRDQCTPSGVISPVTCPYLNDWMNIF